MTTVFAILLIVINLGKGLIVLVNKYAPEEIIVKKQVTPQRQTATSTPVSYTHLTLPTSDLIAFIHKIS